VSAEKASVYRFGVFEFDSHTAELRKGGIKLKLQEQQRQVLVRLLEHPDEIVSRDELRSLLWSENTFVDFETGLNTAVKRLRDTLGDSAENPKFIERIPRKGYKFIAPIEVVAKGDGYKRTITQLLPVRRNRLRTIAYISVASVLVIFGVVIWRNLLHLPKVTNVVQVTNDAKAKFPLNVVVTDGVHLYFVEGTPWVGGSRITQVSALGGETTQVVTSLHEVLAMEDISPDFSELLVTNGVAVQSDPATGRAGGAAELWEQPLPAGTPHRVGDIYATTACYTRDGLHILYADGRALILINRDGTNAHELAKVEGIVRGIRYSPDGKRIRLYMANWQFDKAALWEIDASGNGLRPLLPNWKESPFQCCGSWSADGMYYFFQAGHGTDQAIWVMPEHRFILSGPGSPSRLISGPLQLSAPVPATDGKKLFVKGAELRVEPVRYDSKTRRFEPYLNDMSVNLFEYSHERKWIAYVSYPDMSLWRSRVDGTDKMQLTFPPVRGYGPHWSPDGLRIAYTDIDFDRQWAVSLISASGGTPQSLPSKAPTDAEPNWMPDGKSIVYSKPIDPSSPVGRETLAIFSQDLDTGKVSLIPNSETRFSPRVSPDGRYISAFSQPSTELLLFDSKTNRWSTLAKGELFGYNLWSKDGKYIYMRDNHAGSPRIVRVSIADARLEEVVSLKDLPQLVDPFTGWFGLTPDGDPVVIRDRSTQEIYALDLR